MKVPVISERARPYILAGHDAQAVGAGLGGKFGPGWKLVRCGRPRTG